MLLFMSWLSRVLFAVTSNSGKGRIMKMLVISIGLMVSLIVANVQANDPDVKMYPYSSSANTHGWLVQMGTVSRNGQCDVVSGYIGVVGNVDNGDIETVLTTARIVEYLKRKYKPACVRFAWGATAPVIDMTPHEKYGKERYHRGGPSYADDIAVIRIEVSTAIKRSLMRLSLPQPYQPLHLNGYVTKLEDDTIQEKSVTVLDKQTLTNHLISVNKEYDYEATVWLCIRGEFTCDADSGSPYYVKTSNSAGVLFGIRVRSTPSHSTNDLDNGAVFIDITKYLPWIITTAHGPIRRGYSGKPPPAKYVKRGDIVFDPDTGESWPVRFYQPSHYGDLGYTCNQDVTHLMKIGECFHDPNEPRCYWKIYTPSEYDLS